MERILAVRDEVLRAIAPLPAEEVPLAEATGRHLAVDAVARLASPPYACSAMDGFAVRAEEARGGAPLRVAETLFAGDDAQRALGRGEAARIFTGAPLPPGADAVVIQEVVQVDGGLARTEHDVRPGDNVRRLGEDLEAGSLALAAGTRIGARQAALLASVGADRLQVHRRPKVAVISTGEEIVGGRVPDSNGPAVAGVLRAAGAIVSTRSVGDRPGALADVLREALAASDAVVTIGGVSVGDRDHVAGAVASIGGEKRVHGVPMKPGKPFLFALAGGRPLLGLPGSPSACLVALEVFARPVVLRLAGAARTGRRAIPLTLAAPLPGKPGRARFVWAALEGRGRVRALGRDSAQVRGPALADALLRVPEAVADLPEGAEVEAWLLDDDA
jgi:molybdopterin molybdotransferase